MGGVLLVVEMKRHWMMIVPTKERIISRLKMWLAWFHAVPRRRGMSACLLRCRRSFVVGCSSKFEGMRKERSFVPLCK